MGAANRLVGVMLAVLLSAPAWCDSRPKNIASRGFVGTGDNVLIAGLIIEGDTDATVLIRGRGPSLATFGVASVLADPVLQLFDQPGNLLQTNDAWQAHPRFGGIPGNLAPGDADEAALLVILAPGAYTAILSGVGGTSGVAIVEVFMVNPTTLDQDGDAIPDVNDDDVDGDGFDNLVDVDDFNADISGDLDNDGIDNNVDPDDDNDGTPDTQDAFPLDPGESADSDGNGLGDNAQASLAAGINPYSDFTITESDLGEQNRSVRHFHASNASQRAFGVTVSRNDVAFTVYGRDGNGLFQDVLGETVVESRGDDRSTVVDFNIMPDGRRAFVVAQQSSRTEEEDVFGSTLYVIDIDTNGAPSVVDSTSLDRLFTPDRMFVGPQACTGYARVYIGSRRTTNPETGVLEAISPSVAIGVAADGTASVLPKSPELPTLAGFYANTAWSGDGSLPSARPDPTSSCSNPKRIVPCPRYIVSRPTCHSIRTLPH